MPAVKKTTAGRKPAAGKQPPAAADPAGSFALVGADGRRIVRGHALAACEELLRRIRANGSEEELTIVPSTEA